MTSGPDADPKLLFLLSTDHGELFNAMYFLLGSELRGAVAMPPKLFALNERDFPYPAFGFRSVEDLLSLVDREQPDLVLLFSGYLYVINRLFDLDDFRALLAGLRERGCRVVTTDPSVGVMARVDDDTFDVANPGARWLRELCPQLYEELRDLVHLYLAPEVDTTLRHVSFFNPAIVPDADGLQGLRSRLERWEPIEAGTPRWFFVLSAEDHAVQQATHGVDAFTEMLSLRLAEAAQAGRQPVLIAPRTCVARLRQQQRRIPGLVALSSCNYLLFMRLLYDAEHVFYWNTFSASIVARVVARQPFFLFDEGHLAGTMTPFFETGMRHFYPECTLPHLEPGQPLDADALGEAARAQQAAFFEPVLRNLSRSPTPAEVLPVLLGGGEARTS